MKDNRAFWDASAIVPLCVHENNSARARQTLRRYPRPVVWWGTLAEARSAFARALRGGEITIKEKEHATHHLERLGGFWKEIAPSQPLRELSIRLLDNHSLRTGDARQLAAALVWCEEKPRRRVFICFDDRLATVAKDIGFNVIKA